LSTRPEINFTELLRGYRYSGFDCDEQHTNDWLHRAGYLYGSRRLKMFGLMDGQILLGFVFLNVRERRLRKPGWLEIVALGVDGPHHGKALGRAMLELVEQHAREGRYGMIPKGIFCRSRSAGCRTTLLRHGYQEVDRNQMFALRLE
jgi:GNAT superfamily N-acetyltransferase